MIALQPDMVVRKSIPPWKFPSQEEEEEGESRLSTEISPHEISNGGEQEKLSVARVLIEARPPSPPPPPSCDFLLKLACILEY